MPLMNASEVAANGNDFDNWPWEPTLAQGAVKILMGAKNRRLVQSALVPELFQQEGQLDDSETGEG